MVFQYLLDFGRRDKLVIVALLALEGSVFTDKCKSSLCMVKVRLVELSNLRIPPQMIFVTEDA
jgi:hypothetical protein